MKKLILSIVCLLILFGAYVASEHFHYHEWDGRTEYYVDCDVKGGLRDGSSWENAFRTMAEMEHKAGSGDLVNTKKGLDIYCRTRSWHAHWTIKGWITYPTKYITIHGGEEEVTK